MSERMLSVGEAARRLGVTPVTVQRWVNGGDVTAVRTVGGHRRIPVTEVRRLLATRRSSAEKGQIVFWLDTLLAADAASIALAMRAARRQKGAWYVVVEAIAAALSELGTMWEAGECHVYQEHAASEALKRAIGICLVQRSKGSPKGHAILFTPPIERHLLGLSLAQLVVADAGWDTLWLGEGPPEDELSIMVKDRRPDLLIASCSVTSPRTVVQRYQKALLSVSKRHSVKLILAGAGAWLARSDAQRIESFAELHDELRASDKPIRQ